MWFYIFEDRRQGPVEAEVLRRLGAQGALPGDTPVWRDPMPAWARAVETELADSFGAVPRTAAPEPAAPDPARLPPPVPEHLRPKAGPAPGPQAGAAPIGEGAEGRSFLADDAPGGVNEQTLLTDVRLWLLGLGLGAAVLVIAAGFAALA